MAYIKVQTRDGPKEVRIPWGTIFIVVGIIILLVIINSSYYSVQAGEVGVVQRFGEYIRETGPGLHFKLPWGIEKVTKVNVEYRYKEEFGYKTEQAGITTRYVSPRQVDFETVSLMLTGDLNCAVVEWSVQYNIKDPKAYLFNVRNPEQTLRDMSESVMREIVGDRSVTEVITVSQEASQEQGLGAEVRRQLQDVLDKYNSGIRVTQVVIKTANPPKEVKASFNEVNQAQQQMEQTKNQAEQAYQKIIEPAKGQALKAITEAEGYKEERINMANGDVARFRNLLTEYEKAPDVTRRRIYLETMEKILPKINRTIIIDEEARSILPLLDLKQEGRMP
ncbi:MAG: FtsH protease activity modulator HflK [Planctomycetes bacterium]|nr:FtsH protease activity modulator HflK [Planctomycetota bacterium]